MSQQNIEVVRKIYEGWATGDFRSGVDDLDPQVMFIVSYDFPEFGVYVGPDGVRDYMQRFLEQWERLTIEATHLRAVGDTVLAHVVQHAKGKASGIEGDLRYFTLITFRGDKILRMEHVMHEREALEAVGLSEQPTRSEST